MEVFTVETPYFQRTRPGEKIGAAWDKALRTIGLGEPETKHEWNPKPGGIEKEYINDNLDGKLKNFKYKHVEGDENRPDV